MVYAYTAFNDIMLWCDLEYTTTQQLTPGETQTSSIATAKQNQMFYIAVPPSNSVTCHTTTGSSGSNGDADLYVKFGFEPDTVSSYDASSISVSANEKVGPLSPSTSERILYVMVHAYTAFNDVMLWCDIEYVTSQPTATPTTTMPSSAKPTARPSTRTPTASPTTRKPTTRKPTTRKPTTRKPTTAKPTVSV